MTTIKKTQYKSSGKVNIRILLTLTFFFLMKTGFDMSRPALVNRAFYDNGNVLFCFIQYGSPWRRQWHPTPVLLPGKSHGWRNLVGCSPWGC